METIVISTILVNICIGCFACVGLTTAISMMQSIINDHKREKREQEKDKRDLEYHEKRMKDFKQSINLLAVELTAASTFSDKRRQPMNEFAEILNLFIANVISYTFFAAVYGFIIYNVGKIIFYLVSYAVYHIRRDINKYKSNKDKQ